MKRIVTLFTPLIIALVMSGCSGESEKALQSIREAEAVLYPDSTLMPDVDKARNIISLYSNYAAKYPEDTLSPGFLFKAADISAKINETAQAISLFGTFTTQYPDHSNAAYALFLQGFIYENQVGDPAKAKPYYEMFLSKYPDHVLAKDVEFSLKHLGKTPEELIREFENNQQTDSTEAMVQ